MRKEARSLIGSSIESILLAVEHFNRPSDTGRPTAVLVFLNHAFEMLLKAAIVHRGGRIRERRAKETIGFDHCIRKCLSDAQVRCLTEPQTVTLRAINGLRDAAEHYILSLSESQLYLYAQAGVTLFDDLLRDVFGKTLATYLPERVLPISTKPPRDLVVLMDEEYRQIRSLLVPGSRRKTDARARLRAITILEKAVSGEPRIQPSEGDLNRLSRRVASGEGWQDLFPGITSLNLDTEGSGLPFSIRITKSGEGIPIKLVSKTDGTTPIIAVKRVDELGYYSLGLKELAQKVGQTMPLTLAIVKHLGLQGDPEYFKEFSIGRARFKRYSAKALDHLKKEIPKLDLHQIWHKHKPRGKQASKMATPESAPSESLLL